MIGEFVTSKYLLFVEQIAACLHEEKYVSGQTRCGNLLLEIYKRLLNIKDKPAETKNMQNLEQMVATSHAIFVLAKYLKEPEPSLKVQPNYFEQLVLLIKKQLNIVISLTREQCAPLGKVITFLLNALYHLNMRALEVGSARTKSL
jgi:ABC-type branched-subunit amino acid transport system ATPase component